MIYIFDFDDTIFNTKKFKNDFLEEISKEYFIDISLLKEYFISFSNSISNYTFYDFIDFLNQKNVDISFDVDKFLARDLSSYIKVEDRKFLLELKKTNRVILLTKGIYSFQNTKIKNSQSTELFSDIFIVSEEKNDFLAKDINLQNAIFVNDKEKENYVLVKNFPHMTIYHFIGYNTSNSPDGCIEINSFEQIKKRSDKI